MTTAIAPAPVPPQDSFGDSLFRISVSQYHDMIERGILSPEDEVELLEGLLVKKMPKNKPHKYSTRKLRRLLDQLLPKGWFADSQESVTTVDSEPEPDVLVLRGTEEDYLHKDSGPTDTALIVEIADSSLGRDRTKRRIYARAGFPVYWIVNLPESLIEVYTQPSGPTESPDYLQRQDYTASDNVPLLIEGREVGTLAVKDVLP